MGVAFFFGVVAFFGAAAFFAAGAFFVAALGAAAGALLLVTRPDLVLPRTRDTSSSTAGLEAAGLAAAAAVLRGLLALALGLAAGAALVVVVVVAVFLGRPTVPVFLGAAALVVVVLVFCRGSVGFHED